MGKQGERAAHAFGKRLKARRLEMKMSQEALADITGLHRTEISLLERGGREPRLSTVIKCAGALSLTVDQFLSGITVDTITGRKPVKK